MVHNRKFLGGALFRDWIRFTLLFRLLPLIHHLLQLIIGDPRVLEGVGGVLVPQLPLRRPIGSSVFGLCHFPKSASAIAIGNARLALSYSTAIRVRVVCSNRHFAKDGCNTVQGGESIVVDVSLVLEAAWREAQRRAEVIRPLAEGDRRPWLSC